MMREQDALPDNNLDQQEEDSYMSPYDVDRFTAYLKDQVSNHSMNPLYEVFDKSSTNKDYIDFYDHYFDQIQKCINVRQMNEAMRTEMSSLQGESGTSSSRNPSKSSSKQKSSPEKSQEVRVVLDSLYETSDNGENQLGDPIKSMASLGISEMVMKELKMSRGLNNHKTEKSSDLNKTRILTMSEYEFMKCTGPFLANILTALSNFLTNCFEANLLITSILSKLAASSSSILRNFILLQIDQHPIHVEQKKDPLLNPKWIDNEKSVYLTYSHLLVKYRLNKINNSIESFLMNYASLSLNPYHSNQINSSLEKCNRIFQTPLVNYINLTREKLSELHSEPAQSEERKTEEDGTKNFQLKSIMKHFFGAYNSTSNNGRRYHKGNIKNWLSMQLNLNDVNSNFFRDKILSVIVFEEFCKELSALCVEHSYRI